MRSPLQGEPCSTAAQWQTICAVSERSIATTKDTIPYLRLGGQIAGGFRAANWRGNQRVPTCHAWRGLFCAYGFGSSEGDLGDRAVSGVEAAPIGAAAGFLGSKIADKIVPAPGGGAPTRAQRLMQAGQNLDVPLMPADVGGPTTRMVTAGIRSTPGGVRPITKGAERVQNAAAAARDRIAAGEGEALTPEMAGQDATRGALAYRSSSRKGIGAEYDRARDLAGGARVDPANAIKTLDAHIAELSDTPGGADGLASLQGLRDDLAKRGTVSVDGIRRMRTTLRDKFFKEGLRGSDIERRVNEVVDAASEDLIQSLQDQGKGQAARVYAAADRAWKERASTIDDVLMPIIGKKGEKSGEQVFSALQAATKGNNARFVRFIRSLPEEEAGNARASIVSALGRAKAGGQNAAGDAFSLPKFLTDWNDLGDTAKKALFPGSSRSQIDDLALIAQEAKASSKYANTSNTAPSMVVSGLTAAPGVAGIPGFVIVAKALALQYGAGALLSSQAVTKALVRVSRATSPQAALRATKTLSAAAAREPKLAGDIVSLQSKLAEAFAQSPTRAAAQGQNEGDGR
jgi:hypothetical protein